MSPMPPPSRSTSCAAREPSPLHEGYLPSVSWEVLMRSMLLWLIGIPLPVILILWLVTGHA